MTKVVFSLFLGSIRSEDFVNLSLYSSPLSETSDAITQISKLQAMITELKESRKTLQNASESKETQNEKKVRQERLAELDALISQSSQLIDELQKKGKKDQPQMNLFHRLIGSKKSPK